MLDAKTLMRQASMTSAEYFNEAIKEIDTTFGVGYAKKNPALIGAFMTVAAQDYGHTTFRGFSEDLMKALDSIANKA